MCGAIASFWYFYAYSNKRNKSCIHSQIPSRCRKSILNGVLRRKPYETFMWDAHALTARRTVNRIDLNISHTSDVLYQGQEKFLSFRSLIYHESSTTTGLLTLSVSNHASDKLAANRKTSRKVKAMTRLSDSMRKALVNISFYLPDSGTGFRLQ